ncbi:MAG TPA: 5-formyltetrahydrofolate cyclo-ligase, partial [Pseudonocardiaceae bacterium]|nr:5-formyltetrahydrofolate cyclo-ligase [Pseudonocardiaceae bacterium]
MDGQGEDRYSKREWRTRLLAARKLVPSAQRATEAAALAATIGSIPGDPVCCYLPVGTEPGSLAMLDALAGRRVLLPVVTGAEPLDWAVYEGSESLAGGPYGLLEPTGPRLGAAAVGLAELVLVPALAVDRAGTRLGRGGGHYDRSLPLARPGTPLVAVVRDPELVAALPSEPHDVRLTAALTPIGGLRS